MGPGVAAAPPPGLPSRRFPVARRFPLGRATPKSGPGPGPPPGAPPGHPSRHDPGPPVKEFVRARFGAHSARLVSPCLPACLPPRPGQIRRRQCVEEPLGPPGAQGAARGAHRERPGADIAPSPVLPTCPRLRRGRGAGGGGEGRGGQPRGRPRGRGGRRSRQAPPTPGEGERDDADNVRVWESSGGHHSR